MPGFYILLAFHCNLLKYLTSDYFCNLDQELISEGYSVKRIINYATKPIEKINSSDLGVDVKTRIEQIKVEEPPRRKGGVKVDNVAELVQKLKNEAKVI